MKVKKCHDNSNYAYKGCSGLKYTITPIIRECYQIVKVRDKQL